MKKPKKSKRQSVTKAPEYTHRDSGGMPWRFVGSRPVSKLADQVMRDCGLPIPK
jgi:hypothetical protein